MLGQPRVELVNRAQNQAATPMPTIRIVDRRQEIQVGRFIGCQSVLLFPGHQHLALHVRCRVQSIVSGSHHDVQVKRFGAYLSIQLMPRLLKNPLISPRRIAELGAPPIAALLAPAGWFAGGS